ncbi:Nucleotide-binding, alpha-beta plait [Cynara cardunculus var. scolymus]|uniref:Nucleotide-binding, alpha-beta plait n=1 Tax=Cynara cardunculus var. scolymus TaxID=59895 RepID=A0A103YG53_CYNCS|nr:Nucleotide-binding, alpha-beta plait [Cynara cardunculus var. scolymus]
MISATGWLRPTIGTRSPSPNPKSFKLRASFIEYPLASKIMVRNLSYSTSETCLKEQFSNFGQIAEVKLVKDETTKKSKGQTQCVPENLWTTPAPAPKTSLRRIGDGRLTTT